MVILTQTVCMMHRWKLVGYIVLSRVNVLTSKVIICFISQVGKVVTLDSVGIKMATQRCYSWVANESQITLNKLSLVYWF
jgi:hypothetical protein